MTFFKDLWADLVEKRLWPVAVLLVAAMVAAPVVFAGGSSAGAPPPAPAPAPVAGAVPGADKAAVPVSLDPAPAQPAPGGRYKDPFAGAAKAVAKQTAAANPQSPAVAPSSSAASPSPSSSASGAPAASRTTPSSSGGVRTTPSATPVAPAVTPKPVPTGYMAGHRIDLHWGTAGSAKPLHDVIRLRRLDAGSAPLLVYLGTRLDGKHALFLLATAAGVAGDGRCMPVPKACQVIELAAGESEFFDVTGADGAVNQYELDIDRIADRRVATRSGARALRERASKLGAQVVSDAVAAGRDYVKAFRYRTALGVVVRDVSATRAWLRQATYAEVGMNPGQ